MRHIILTGTRNIKHQDLLYLGAGFISFAMAVVIALGAEIHPKNILLTAGAIGAILVVNFFVTMLLMYIWPELENWKKYNKIVGLIGLGAVIANIIIGLIGIFMSTDHQLGSFWLRGALWTIFGLLPSITRTILGKH